MMRVSQGSIVHWSMNIVLLLLTGALLGILALKGIDALWGLIGLLVIVFAIIVAIRNIQLLTVVTFSLLLLGEILANRAFSHIVLGKPPLYITEVTMFILAMLLVAQRKFLIPAVIRTPFLLIMLVCVVSAAINLFRFSAVSVMRDSAELYYMMFIPLAYSIFTIMRVHLNRHRAERLGIVVAFLVPLLYLVTRSIQVPATSEAVAGSIILVAISWDFKAVSSRVVWLAILINLVALFDGGARGPWIGFFVGLAVLAIGSGAISDSRHRHRVRYQLAVFAAVLILAAVGVAIFDAALLTHLIHDIGSVTSFSGSYSQVANNRWRMIIWGEAFRQFLANPLAIRVGQGWMPIQLIALGYGGVNTTGYALNTVALSNSYLQMLQWYGIWAAIPFWWMVIKLWRTFARNIRCHPALYSVIGLMSLWAINTGVEVVLEGPYMSAIVWSIIGFGLTWMVIGGADNAFGSGRNLPERDQ